MDREHRRERGIALLAVIAVHVGIGSWLGSWRLVDASHAQRDDMSDALIVEFVVRQRTPPTATRRSALQVHSDPPLRANRPASGAGADTKPSADGSEGIRTEPAGGTTLDLRLPAASVTLGTAPGQVVEREVRLPGRSTRFERQWAPSGDVIEAASWRSPVIRTALGLFGGPPKKCDEVERRLRRPDCLPDEADFERR